MIAAGRFTVAADHPALAGHFPGNPVVPGVVLLDRATSLILDALPGQRLAGLPQVKFLHPVRPGEALEVLFEPDAARIAFACLHDGKEAVRGTLLIAGDR